MIVVIVTLSAHASNGEWKQRVLAHGAMFFAAALIAVLVYYCYAYAPRLSRLIPQSAANGIQRLVSFILLCIGVQLAWRTRKPCSGRSAMCTEADFAVHIPGLDPAPDFAS